MAVTIAGVSFDNVFYDREVDVLYLHVGAPSTAVDFDGTIEGHHVRFDSEGRLVGITILNARQILEREGKITVTVPTEVSVEAADLGDVLTAA